MSELTLPQDTILLGEHEYAVAADIVITEAQQQLLIFDQDLSTGGFATAKRAELIQAFLSKNAMATLTIILHNTDFFSSQCPKLLSCFTAFSHKMTIYQTNHHAKIAKDCFILADDKAYIRRFHIDQARFKYRLDDAEITASLANRFSELLQETTHTMTATTLGL